MIFSYLLLFLQFNDIKILGFTSQLHILFMKKILSLKTKIFGNIKAKSVKLDNPLLNFHFTRSDTVTFANSLGDIGFLNSLLVYPNLTECSVLILLWRSKWNVLNVINPTLQRAKVKNQIDDLSLFLLIVELKKEFKLS